MSRGRMRCRSTARPFPGSSTLLLFLLFLGTLWPGKASSQTPSDKVLDLLDSASGFQLLGDIQTGVLESGHAMRITAILVEGADYMIAGSCDDGCSNLDLSLFDPSGNLVAEDHLPDSEPVLMFTAEATGSFGIQVEAIECSSEGCDIAVGILGSTSEPGAIPGEDMTTRLRMVSSELEVQGFTEIEERKWGALGPEESVSIPFTLVGGMDYRIVGVCDVDCLDLDLALLDSDSIEVDADVLEDALPILYHQPDSTGEYSVEVTMVACAVAPCSFRIATFADQGPDRPGGKTMTGILRSHVTHEGELTPQDEQLDMAYVDTYEVEVEAGNRLVLDLRSGEFDPVLRMVPPEGKVVENDDYGTDTSHSHIEHLALVSGTYSVQVTSYYEHAIGPYSLQIAVIQ